jgi:hypothetical protein
MCLLRSILISIIKQAHGATPTSDMDIGASQTRLLSNVLTAINNYLSVFSNVISILLLAAHKALSKDRVDSF